MVRFVQPLVALALIVLAALAGPRLVPYGAVSPLNNAVDFRAFYCAGEAVRRGSDPYRVEPLRACEDREIAATGLHTYATLVVAAPLPPYALAAFAALSFVPYPQAVCGWFALELLCIVATAMLLARRWGIASPITAVLLSLALLDSMMLGQIDPVVVLLLVLAATAASSNDAVIASLAIGAAMLKPQLALPAALSLFALMPRFRLPFLAVAGALAVLSLVVLRPPIVLEYITAVLPLHALSETGALQTQYSLTTILGVLGVAPESAVRIGELDYSIMIGLGIAVAARAVKATGERALLVLLPSTFALLGGVYIHVYDFGFALMTALVMYRVVPGLLRPLFFIGGAGILCSMLLDAVFGSGQAGTMSASYAETIAQAAQPDALASAVSRLYHESRMDHAPAVVAELVALKVPAFIGLSAILFGSARLGLRNAVARARRAI